MDDEATGGVSAIDGVMWGAGGVDQGGGGQGQNQGVSQDR
jgi:hypothetical protein